MRTVVGIGAAVAVTGLGTFARAEDATVPPATEERAPRRQSKNGLYLKVQSGYALRDLYGVPIDSGGIEAGLGARLGIVSVYFDASFLFGSTRQGLGVRDYDLGPTLELALWRFRIGGGLYLGALSVDRATSSGSLASLNVGVRGHLTFDVFEWGAPVGWGKSGGVYLGVEPSVGAVQPGSWSYGGAMFLLGVRPL